MQWWAHVKSRFLNTGSPTNTSSSKVPPSPDWIPDLAHQSFLQFASIAQKLGIRYLVFGAAALTLNRLGRSTDDIDLWIESTPENLTKFTHALQDMGYADAPDWVDCTDTGKPQMWRLAGPMDMLTYVHQQFDFETCYQRRTELSLNGTPIPILHLLDVKDLKLRARRDQDYRDAILIDNFLRAHGQPTEWPNQAS